MDRQRLPKLREILLSDTRLRAFKKGEIVAVKDQTHGRVIAVGLALEDSEVAKAMTKGYVIDTIHYLTDKIWEAYKRI